MTDKERLIELLHKAEDICDSTLNCDTCKYVESGSCKTVLIADYLLANGVIVPPCKVGDIVYYPYEYGNKVLEKAVKKMVIENDDKWLDVGVSFLPFENIGKTVFLTKEEAEAKLKEMGKNEKV